MWDQCPARRIQFAAPASYCIEVDGRLGESWSDRLGGMRINTSLHGDQCFVTTLVGELSDQAALIGVLNCLYEMRLPIIRVEHQLE
jgi:hypothetical protein